MYVKDAGDLQGPASHLPLLDEDGSACLCVFDRGQRVAVVLSVSDCQRRRWRRDFSAGTTALSAIDLALGDFFPDALGSFLHNNPPPRGKIEIISLVLLLFTANGVFEPLEVGLNQRLGHPKNRSFFRNQLVSLALIFICGGLVLSSLLMTAFSQESFRKLTGAGPAWLPQWVFSAIPMLDIQDGGGADDGAGAVPDLSIFAERKASAGARDSVGDRDGRPAGSFETHQQMGVAGILQKLDREYNVFKNSVTLILIGFLVSMLVLAGAEWSARGHRMERR